MKQLIPVSTCLLAVLFLFLFPACSDTPKGDQAKISGAEKAAESTGQTYLIDTSASRIHFVGNGVGKNHPGNFHLNAGSVSVMNNQITGGEFTINIKSMILEQQEAMIQQKLGPHLMSGDFLDAAKFNTAKFVITQVTPYQSNGADTSIVQGANFNVSGNLTIKEDTKNITFPARVDLDGNTLKAKSNFNIDRTQWRINYGNDKTLGDKFISETVNIKLDLQAKKQ